MTDRKPRLSTASWWAPVLTLGIPLGVSGVIFALDLVYREDLEQAGLDRIMGAVHFLVPMAALALVVVVGAYLNVRAPDSNGERPVSRAAASKKAISVTLLLVVFPLLPITIMLFRSEPGLDFTTVILIGVCVAGLQFVWPLLLGVNLDHDQALEEKLRARIQSLAETAGVQVGGVVVARADDDDDDDDSPFAFACGLGRSRRVVIGGRMAEMLEPEELDAIVAHEFAHVSEHHIAKKITVIFFLAMGLAALDRTLGEVALGGFLLLVAACLLCVLLKLAFDRRFEVTADRLAADWVGARNLRNAFAKLAACDRPSRLPPWLATHPPIPERIRILESRMTE